LDAKNRLNKSSGNLRDRWGVAGPIATHAHVFALQLMLWSCEVRSRIRVCALHRGCVFDKIVAIKPGTARLQLHHAYRRRDGEERVCTPGEGTEGGHTGKGQRKGDRE